jgi:hypothetical protein
MVKCPDLCALICETLLAFGKFPLTRIYLGQGQWLIVAVLSFVELLPRGKVS